MPRHISNPHAASKRKPTKRDRDEDGARPRSGADPVKRPRADKKPAGKGKPIPKAPGPLAAPRMPKPPKAAASKETAAPKPAHTAKPSKAKLGAPEAHDYAPKRSMRIIVGSYERFLYGLSAHMQTESDGSHTCVVEPQFVFPAHVSSIRSVACAGNEAKWLVTGGTDETIKVWDLRRRKEVGALMGHEGTITSLSFPSRTFMLSASEDSVLNLYRTRDWALLRTLRGHTGRINSASAHPSGRIALSVGADKMIRMWDLMRGHGAASVKIGVEADRILWDTRGKRFAVLAQRQIMVFSTDMSKLAEIEQPKRLHDLCFVRAHVQGIEHELMLVAAETGVVSVFDLDDMQAAAATDDDEEALSTPREIGRLVGHTNRYVATTYQCAQCRCGPCGRRRRSGVPFGVDHQFRRVCARV